MKYLFICKSWAREDIKKINKALNEDDWNYIITNMNIIFEKINDDLTKIELLKEENKNE